jgi:hypothetical protein
MGYPMNFSRLMTYDAGRTGILIDVTLSLAEGSVTLPTKLDTGATNCVFTRCGGEDLGIAIESGEPVHINTAVGSFVAYHHDVTLTVLDFVFDVRVCFAADGFFNRNVLGRRGFLDRVNLGLVDYEGKLYLSKYGEAE